MRARLAVLTAMLFLAASLACTAWAIASLFGALKVPEMLVQMLIGAGALGVMMLAMPPGLIRTMNTSRLASLTPSRAQLRAQLTGPFGEAARIRRRVTLFQVPLLVLSLAAVFLLPFFLFGLALFLIRGAAYEGDPIATPLDRFFGTRPKLPGNQRRS